MYRIVTRLCNLEAVIQMHAVILAAGKGERMQPLTNAVPKPLLPIDGRPVLEHSLRMLEQCAVEDVVIVVGYMKEEIKTFVGTESFAMHINYVHQEQAKGSGDALKRAGELLDQAVIVIASDTVFRTSEIREMIALFQSSDLNALVGLRKLPLEQLKRRSTVRIDQNGFIEQIIEKPQEGAILSSISAAPVFVFSPKIWVYLENLAPSKNGKYELATAIQSLIKNEGKVKGYFLSRSRDITRPIDVLRENFAYLKEMLDT